jgi:alternate signal-mediated exported protein
MNSATSKATRSRRRKGVIAGIAGSALLLGGATFATWSDSANMGGAGVITSGKLAVAAVGTGPVMYDITENRLDLEEDGVDLATAIIGQAGHGFSSTQQPVMSPGDTYAIVYPFTVEIEGENLVARVYATFGTDDDPYINLSGFKTDDEEEEDEQEKDGEKKEQKYDLDVKYALVADINGDSPPFGTLFDFPEDLPKPGEKRHVGAIAPEGGVDDEWDGVPGLVIGIPSGGSTGTLNLVVFVTFLESAQGSMDEALELGPVTMALEQSRRFDGAWDPPQE